MTSCREFRAATAAVLASALAAAPARGLVALNDGSDRIHVNASVGMSHDSNVFATADGAGDVVYHSALSAEYARRAGMIGVNGKIGVSSSRFAEIDGQDFANPNLTLEFTKQSGRTTGSLTLNGARESRADAAVNARTTAWNYGTGLGVRYPVAGTLTLSGTFGYDKTDYTDAPLFSDLATVTSGLDLFHIFTPDRDLLGGYRYRHGETSRSSSFTDHSFTTGVSGKIIRGVNGMLRGGYQFRVPRGLAAGEGEFSSWTASGSATYPFNKRLNVSGVIAKDFATTALDSFVDTLTAGLDAQYLYNSRWSLTAGVATGSTEFLGERGRVVIVFGPQSELGAQRHDTYATWNAALNYARGDRFKVSAAYTWFQNWSTTPFADFVRTTWNLNVSTRW